MTAPHSGLLLCSAAGLIPESFVLAAWSLAGIALALALLTAMHAWHIWVYHRKDNSLTHRSTTLDPPLR